MTTFTQKNKDNKLAYLNMFWTLNTLAIDEQGHLCIVIHIN